ncbi:MAG: hypothetical protein IJ200_04885 [Prevotella sp.]|nr:hypothetical protein [Prevotella sp.]
MKVNNLDVTEQVDDGRLTIDHISSNLNVEVNFEAIPPTNYTLTITASGNGSASYNGISIRDKSSSFTVVDGTYATIVFTPDNDFRVKRVKVDNGDVTLSVTNKQYVMKITADTELSVEFVEDLVLLADNGVNYKVVSYDLQTVCVAMGDYGRMLTVPAMFTAKGKTWTVVGVDEDALTDNTELAAIIWKADVAFNGRVSNPNLLLYVKGTEFAPKDMNVVVNGHASSITLTDAASSNDFYCPQTFTASRVTYEHYYSMTSGYKNCQGWETIALPYDVSAVTGQTGTALVPYTTWAVGSSSRPFWLYELTTEGWKAATTIQANTPYIISMPNNKEYYDADYNITGKVVFTGTNVEMKASDELTVGMYGQKCLMPNFQQKAIADIYALNVSNEYVENSDVNHLPGSTFLRNSRPVHPFEAYLTVEGSAARAIPIFDGNEDTGIGDALRINKGEVTKNNNVFNLNGQRVQTPGRGLYIVNGKKVVMK